MSKKPLLSESQVAKWMKLANIDKNATQNFLTENKKSNKKLVKENMSYARQDEESPVDDMESMDDMGGMDDMGDGAMGEEPSVEEPMDDMGADEGEVTQSNSSNFTIEKNKKSPIKTKALGNIKSEGLKSLLDNI